MKLTPLDPELGRVIAGVPDETWDAVTADAAIQALRTPLTLKEWQDVMLDYWCEQRIADPSWNWDDAVWLPGMLDG